MAYFPWDYWPNNLRNRVDTSLLHDLSPRQKDYEVEILDK